MNRRLGTFFIILCFFLLFPQFAQARFNYEIGQQIENLRISPSGEVILEKYFTFHVLSSSNEDGTEVWVGLPTEGTKVLNASYTKGGSWSTIPFSTESGDGEQYVIFESFQAIHPGETGEFRFTARVPNLVHWLNKEQLKRQPEDQLVSLSFIPAWWENGVVRNLTVHYTFTENVHVNRLQTLHSKPRVSTTPDGDTQLTWNYQNVGANVKVNHAVIIPRTYFTENAKIQKDWMPLWAILLIVTFVGGGFVLVIWTIIYSVRTARYRTPLAYMKGSNAYTSFDPVECAVFYNVPTNLLVQMIIMGLMEKNVIQLDSNQRLKRVPTIETLTWYEKLYLESIDKDVELIPDKWHEAYKDMIKHFKNMVEGYCGHQTANYYTKWLKETTFDENSDPRWIVLQQQLAKGIFEKPSTENFNQHMPSYMNAYLPLFYLTVVNPHLARKNEEYYNRTFPGYSGTGNNGGGGTGCACACACACAGSGGCT